MRRIFVRNLRKMYKTVMEPGNSLHRGPLWGPWRGFVYRDFLRDRKRRALETQHLILI